jgi:flagellar protein FlbD
VIKVSKLNGKSFIINALYIETIETFPDTTITLTNGNKYIVREKEDKVLELISTFYQSVNLLGSEIGGSGNEE